MTQTTNYNLNIVEGTDVVNPLVQVNPNFQTIDQVMKANEDKTVATATEVKSGTNHAITTVNDANMFRFVATSDFRTGDTFSVDGTTVTATLSSGELPKDRAFVVGTSVVCILDGTRLTLVNCEATIPAVSSDDVTFDPTGTNLTETNVEDVIKEVNNKTKEFHIVNLDFSTVGDLETWLSETISGLWYITGTYAINQYGAYFDNFSTTLYAVAGSFNGTDTTISAKAIGNNYIGGYARCYIILQRV